MPKIEVGTVLENPSLVYFPEFWEPVKYTIDGLSDYKQTFNEGLSDWDKKQKPAFKIIWNSLVGPMEVKRLSDGKHFKIGDVTNWGKITHFPCYREHKSVIVEDLTQFFTQISVHIDKLELLSDSKTPFEKRGMRESIINANRLLRRLSRRERRNIITEDEKAELKWFKNWLTTKYFTDAKVSQTPAGATTLLEDVNRVIAARKKKGEYFNDLLAKKKFFEDWLLENSPYWLQSVGCMTRKGQKTPIIEVMVGARGVGKTFYQQELINAHMKNHPKEPTIWDNMHFVRLHSSPLCVNFSGNTKKQEQDKSYNIPLALLIKVATNYFEGKHRTFMSVPMGLGKAATPKPPLGIIPEQIHNENRLNDINNAIDRYVQADKAVPAAWLVEKKELETKLKQK